MGLPQALLRWLRPPACLGCGRVEAWPCCDGCLPVLPGAPGPWRLAADKGVTVWALGRYRGGLRAAVLAGKLGGQAAALEALGRRLGAALAAAGAGADLVTWVAGRPGGGRPRDHAARLAAGVAAALGLPAVRLLAPAAGPDLGRERRAGAAPPARRPPRVLRGLAGGRVLLVDDVATTGGTLAGAAGALRHAGAGAVEAAALAVAAAALAPGPAPPGRARSRRGAGPAGFRAIVNLCPDAASVESGQTTCVIVNRAAPGRRGRRADGGGIRGPRLGSPRGSELPPDQEGSCPCR